MRSNGIIQMNQMLVILTGIIECAAFPEGERRGSRKVV